MNGQTIMEAGSNGVVYKSDAAARTHSIPISRVNGRLRLLNCTLDHDVILEIGCDLVKVKSMMGRVGFLQKNDEI